MSTIATALLAAVWYWLGGSFIGYTIYPIVISPTVIGMVFGFLYGDVTTGLIAGASLEVIYIGMVNAGGNLPADRMLAGLIAIPVVLQTGVDPQVAVSIAIPVGIIGVFLNNIRRTGNAFLIQKVDVFGKVISLQEVLDQIAPGILPLTLVFGVFYLMKVKKMSMLKILLILIGVCLVGALIGFF